MILPATPSFLPSVVADVWRFLLTKVIALDKAQHEYARLQKINTYANFPETFLGARGIRVEVSRHETIRIPTAGACIVVANHPLGAADGVAMLREMLRVRPDVRILANEILNRVAELQEYIIPLNVLATDAQSANASSLRMAHRHLESGGMLIAFPAGEVSAVRCNPPGIRDRDWSTHVARLAQSTKATMVPAYIHARNSVLFYLAGVLHPKLRTLLLIRELLKFKNTDMRIVFGMPQRLSSELRKMSAKELSEHIRFRCEFLRFKDEEPRGTAELSLLSGSGIDKEARPHDMALEIHGLDERHQMIETDDFLVVAAEYHHFPTVMKEIGRLREVTFRLAGEGTGKSSDIDVYDSMYTHLVVWNKTRSEVAGAYRLGRVDELTRRYGKHGLYLSTLFDLTPKFLHDMNASLELGRSFVRPEYQRDSSVLYLLLKGIGIYVSRNPHYRYLMGPVSISDSFSENSKRLMVNSLFVHHYYRALAKEVRPKNPLEYNLFANWDRLLHSRTLVPVTQMDRMIRDLEHDGKSVPVLLRHYLHLGGGIVAMNRDASFGNCLDALIVIDMHRADPSALRRYMGAEGLDSYRRGMEAKPRNIPAGIHG
jgi:putative hemolysin